MKHLKIFALAALVVMAVTVSIGAGTASATELYKYTTPSANDTLGVGTVIKASTKASTSLLMTDTFWFEKPVALSTCTTSELQMKIENAGGEGSHPSGKVTALGFALCSHLTAVLNRGEIEFRHIAGTTNATVIWKNFETTFPSTAIGIQCIAKTGPEAEVGTLTGVNSSTGHATFHLNAQLTYVGGAGGGFPCGHGPWTGTFTVTTPTGLIAESK